MGLSYLLFRGLSGVSKMPKGLKGVFKGIVGAYEYGLPLKVGEIFYLDMAVSSFL